MSNDSVMLSALSGGTATGFSHLFDSLPVAACLIDRDGRILRANPPARARWRTVDVGDVLHDALQHLNSAATQLCTDRECVLRRPPVSAELRRDREPFRRADGSTIVFDWLSAPWRDSESSGPAAIVLLREVTERAAERDRARLRQIFDQIPASLAVLRGPDHEIEVANARAEALGTADRQVLDDVYRNGRSHVISEMPITIAGEERFFNLVYQPIKSADGSVDAILSFGIDVTDQVRTTRDVLNATRARDQALVVLASERRRLEIINRELDQFAYAASHDLKAPLRGIANLAQWIEEDLHDQLNEGTREMLALMRSRMHRMEALIEGLLQFSRAGRVEEKPERVDTAALVADIVELLAPPEDTLVFISPKMPTLSAERVPLQQVFSNLVGNAIKYAGRADARIFVDAVDCGDAYEFSVTDNGPGIAPEYHERVWGIFQSLQPHDKVEGTGIGLALVKKIVEARGGHVGLASRPGEGARFSFTWPRSTARGDA